MDKDRVVGSAKQVKGAVKQVVGKAVGDAKLVSEGKAEIRGQGSECHRRPQRHGQRRTHRKIGRCGFDPPHSQGGKGHSPEGRGGWFSKQLKFLLQSKNAPKKALWSHRQRLERCNCCCRPDSRSTCIRCWHGLFGRIPVGQFGCIGEYIPNRHRCLSDCRRYARLYHWRVHCGEFAYKMGWRPHARSLLSRHRSWLFRVENGHGSKCCVFDSGGQQHCWKRIVILLALFQHH